MAPNDRAGTGTKTGDRDKALDTALAQIERQFGRGAIMRLGDDNRAAVEVIPTGAIALDVALGIGGLPRGRIVEIYGPESSGKCLLSDTYVWSDRGLETVAEVFERAGLKASCTSRVTDVSDLDIRLVNERGSLERVSALTHNNLKPVLRLRLKSGRTVSVTHNHPLRAMSERGLVVWREAGQIRNGDTLVSALFGALEAAGGDGLSEDEAVLLGYLVAEGSLSARTRVGFTNCDPEVSGEYTRIMESLFDVRVRNYYDKEFVVHSVALRDRFARDYGLDYVTAAGKKVPHCVRTAGHKVQSAFLSALFEGDGWIDPTSTVGLGTASEELARQVQLMLYGFGIPATVSSKYNAKYQRDYWTVTINPAVTHRFLVQIGFRSAGRQTQVEKCFRACPLRELAESSYTYEEVVAVEDAGLQPTFDVVMPDTHSFLANGVLSHNTSLALHAVANAQKAGGIAAFVDAEHALDPEYAKKVGVDTDALLVSQPDTGEQGLEIADMLVRSGAIDIIVIDSVAALVPRAEIEGEMGDSHVGLQARLMSQALRKLAGALNQTKTTAVFINQLREKIGVLFGSPETTTGGRALKFYASVRLDIRRIETLKDGTDSVGSRTKVKVAKNKMAAPFKTAEFDILYGQGISREGGLIDVGVEQGIVRKSGAWYTYEGDQLGQGKENARTFLRDNPDLANEIEKRIKEKLGVGPRLDAEAPGPAPGAGTEAALDGGLKVVPGSGR